VIFGRSLAQNARSVDLACVLEEVSRETLFANWQIVVREAASGRQLCSTNVVQEVAWRSCVLRTGHLEEAASGSCGPRIGST